ncbi:MAG TPA: hypothetical protein VF691_08705 [Cytophagaceae bacterium]|jgi:hypothetical protein
MQDLDTLKALQTTYQAKFSQLLTLQEELNISGTDAADSPEYILVKEEWIKAGNELKSYLEQFNNI